VCTGALLNIILGKVSKAKKGKEKYFTGAKFNPLFYPFLFRVMVTWEGKPEDQPVLFWMGG